METSSPSYSELLNLKPSTLNPFAVDRPGIPQQAAERLSEAEARWCLQGFTGYVYVGALLGPLINEYVSNHRTQLYITSVVSLHSGSLGLGVQG